MSRRARVRPHRQIGLLLVGALLLGVLALPAPAPAGATPSPAAPSLRLRGPAVAELGGLTRVQVVVDHAATLGAFQANLRFDERAVEVARVEEPAVWPGTGAVTPLSDVETPDRKILAAYSCTAPACGARAGSLADGTAIATVDVTPWRAGRIELRLDGGLVVDRSGAVIGRTAPSTISIDVDATRPVWPAPRGAAVAVGTPRARDARDVNRDGRVTTTDVVAMQRGFVVGADDDVACPVPEAATDVDGDGCSTIADLQTVAAAAAPQPRASAAATSVTYVVNSTGDGVDAATDGVCQTVNAGECTLRAALQEANAAAGPAEIDFGIPGGGIKTIQPATALPALANANGITIDGFTQPGAAPNTDPIADNAKYRIELRGQGVSKIDGLYVSTDNNTIRGLDMDKWRRAIWIVGGGFDDVVGNMIGLTPGGALINNLRLSRPGNCVVLEGGAHDDEVGAPGAANRNVISGCAHNGVSLYDYGTKNVTIQNNIVGLDPTGTQARGSVAHGIDLNTGTQFTTVGGSDPSLRNVSSGNQQEGIEISHNPLTQHDSVVGNFIGTDLTGDNAPAYAENHTVGLRLEGNPDCANKPCPSDEGFMTVTDNVIANSGGGGVMIDKGVHDSVFARNKVGLTANGTAAGNAVFGVRLEAGAVRITIGPGNEIAHNATGIQLQAIGTSPPNSAATLTDQDTFTRNSIYSNDKTGTAALGIDLAPFGTVNTANNSSANVNDAMVAPVLSNATTSSVDAQTCGSCVVEVFVADRAAGAVGSGATYLASATASSAGVAHVALPAAAAGQVVTATATNTGGSTSEFSRNVAIPASSSTVASDSFSRNVSNGWGNADVGGAYTLQGAASDFGAAFGAGVIAVPTAATGNAATLLSTSARDVDERVDAGTSAAPAGGTWGQVVYLTARRTAANTEYRVRLRFQVGGPVKLSFVKVVGSTTEVQIGSEVALALSYAAGQLYTLRFDVTGANPTTLQAKAWVAGTTEPAAWALTATDSQAALQASGAVGVRAFLGGGATTFPSYLYDNLDAADLG